MNGATAARRARYHDPAAESQLLQELDFYRPLDLERVQFTQHALERFAERFPAEAAPDPLIGARKLLAGATEHRAISRFGYIVRALGHKFDEVRYFRNGSIRFVIKPEGDEFYILTIERAER